MNKRFPAILVVLFALACSRETPAPATDTATTTQSVTTNTTITDTVPVPPPSTQRVGPPLRHYRLWNIRPVKIQGNFPQTVQLMETLSGGAPWSATVIKPGISDENDRAYVANPVRKTHGTKTFEYENNDPHYVMYVVKSDHKPPAQAAVKNQFTQETWKLKKEYRLLVPAAKSLTDNPGTPPNADHFVCIGVDTQSSVEANITLVDQFQDRIKTNPDGSLRLTPKYFCAAVSKKHEGPWIQARNPGDRLAIYQLSPYATVQTFPVWTRDQFAQLTFQVERGDLLAVPQNPD